MALLTFDAVAMMIGVAQYPPLWQDRIIRDPTFPSPIDGAWSEQSVRDWKVTVTGRSLNDPEPVELTREELEDETVSLPDSLVADICAAAGNRCQCDRPNCHPKAGIHGLPVRPPRLKVFPRAGRWPRPAGPPSAYGVVCVACGNATTRARASEFEDDV